MCRMEPQKYFPITLNQRLHIQTCYIWEFKAILTDKVSLEKYLTRMNLKPVKLVNI